MGGAINISAHFLFNKRIIFPYRSDLDHHVCSHRPGVTGTGYWHGEGDYSYCIWAVDRLAQRLRLKSLSLLCFHRCGYKL